MKIFSIKLINKTHECVNNIKHVGSVIDYRDYNLLGFIFFIYDQ